MMAEQEQFPETPKTLLEKWGKIRIANAARCMANNQRVADNCHKHDAAWRQMGMDVLNWRNKQMGVDGGKPAAAEEDMDIRFDSPQTINHINIPKPGLGTLGKLALGGALLASGVGAGFAVPILWSALKPKPSTVIHQGADDSDTATDIGFWDK